MRTFDTILIGAILCLLLSGCYVQSLHPFYIKSATINFTEIGGEWKVIKHGERYIPFSEEIPWRFHERYIEIADDKGVRSRIEVAYFKLSDEVFMDSTADDPERQGGLGKYWVAHVYPIHMLCKVVMKEDTLTLLPLSYDWFKENRDKLRNGIPYVEIDDPVLFTATPEQ